MFCIILMATLLEGVARSRDKLVLCLMERFRLALSIVAPDAPRGTH